MLTIRMRLELFDDLFIAVLFQQMICNIVCDSVIIISDEIMKYDQRYHRCK